MSSLGLFIPYLEVTIRLWKGHVSPSRKGHKELLGNWFILVEHPRRTSENLDCFDRSEHANQHKLQQDKQHKKHSRYSRWFKVIFLSPGWRSLNLWKGHGSPSQIGHQQNCQVNTYELKTSDMDSWWVSTGWFIPCLSFVSQFIEVWSQQQGFSEDPSTWGASHWTHGDGIPKIFPIPIPFPWDWYI